MDTLGCGLLALSYPACTKLLGPVVPGATMPGVGARVPGTSFELDPVQAAFNIGAMVRWLDFNDTWLAAEWGHPSDNLGAILAVADYLSRRAVREGERPLTMRDVLLAMIQAHEIQGVLALENGFNRVGLDHVLLVRIASTAVATRLLGGTREDLLNALSNAWIDGGALRTYRHAPNTGSRKSLGGGRRHQPRGAPRVVRAQGRDGLSQRADGEDVGFPGRAVSRADRCAYPRRGLARYVMEHVLFKISFPAEFHAQTAVEAAVTLHPQVAGRLEEIERIVIETQESGKRIIDKTGPLANPADRDHCIQYMVAVAVAQGHADRGRLRGRRGDRPAAGCVAREDGGRGKRGFHARLPRPGETVHRQRGAGVFQGRHRDAPGGGGIPHRPPPPARGRVAGADGEIRARACAGACPRETQTPSWNCWATLRAWGASRCSGSWSFGWCEARRVGDSEGRQTAGEALRVPREAHHGKYPLFRRARRVRSSSAYLTGG